MEQKYYLNLTYGNPTEDFENSVQYNSNGIMNINLTLLALKNRIESNIKVIDSLLENQQFIKNISVEDYNNISIVLDDVCKDKLLKDKIVNSTKKQIIEEDIFGFDDSDNNSNTTRLQSLNNITNTIEDMFFNTSQDNIESDSSSEIDEIFNYNVDSIINRYTDTN